MTRAPLTLLLFGPMRVLVHGDPLPRVRARTTLWLLALLALRQGRAVERSWLAGTLWPESEEAQALQNLRHALVELRKALGPEGKRIQSPQRDFLALDLEGAETDLLVFDHFLRVGGEAGLRRAVEVYTGPLLEGCAAEWAGRERDSRQQACLQALEILAEAARQRQEYAAALLLLRRAEGMDPFRDSTQRGLMQVLAEGGDTPAALLAYRDFRLRLRGEMNLEPDAETSGLYQALLVLVRGSSPAPAPLSVPPPAALPTAFPLPPLPHVLTTLIGRDDEARAVTEAVAASRLVTLVGGGGVGKTRLALHVAREGAPRGAFGAAFVALASLSDPALLPAFVAAALGLREEAAPEPEFFFQALKGRLSTHPLLLVLDNCEHLMEATANLVHALLEHCPNLHILTTSRQRLGLTGELVWQVPALPAPDPERLAQEEEPVRAALQYPAVQLLVERAALLRPGFRLASRAEALAAARICRRLDGMPLAIELAATRVGLLKVEQIAARLDHRFRLLTGGSRGVAPRHQTLRALIDWSYDLLTPAEQALLRLLSVFAGGWTLEAAEAMAAATEARGRENGATSAFLLLQPCEVLDILASLLDKSLVLAEVHEAEARYRMLETVREYAREKLRENGEEEAAGRRHARYCLDLAEQCGESLQGFPAGAAPVRLEAEVDNLRAALAWAQHHPSDLYLRLAAALWPFWELRGYLTEGRTHLRAALKRSDLLHSPVRVQALLGAATLALSQWDMDEVFLFAREGLEEARVLEDTRGMAASLFCLAEVYVDKRDVEKAVALIMEGLEHSRRCAWLEGRASAMILLGRAEAARVEQPDWEQIKSCIEEGLALAEMLGDSRMVASACFRLGDKVVDLKDYAWARATHSSPAFTAALQQDYARARTLLFRSLEIYRRLGDKMGVCRVLGALGRLERRDNPEQALAHTLEYVKIARELGNAGDEAHALHQVGVLHFQQGRYQPARQAYTEALAIFGRLHWKMAFAHNNLGSVLFHLGEPEAARKLHREALCLYLENQHEEGIVWALERYTVVEAQFGDTAKAALLLGAAAARRERLGLCPALWDQADWDRAVSTVRAALGDEPFHRAYAQGRVLYPEWAVEQALGTAAVAR